MSRFCLKTGDLILFDYGGWGIFGFFSYLIKYFTNSQFSHIGMVLKDPDFLNCNLKGYYIWESSWEGTPDSQDGKVKLGVQITPFEETYNLYKKNNSHIFVRRLESGAELFTNSKLTEIHNIVYNKPYDLVPADWWNAFNRVDSNPQKTSRFWCSALIGYIYTTCGLLKGDTDWSNLRPSDFSSKHKNVLKFDKGSLSKRQEEI